MKVREIHNHVFEEMVRHQCYREWGWERVPETKIDCLVSVFGLVWQEQDLAESMIGMASERLWVSFVRVAG